MPSRPMLTTPARSENSPPRPARPIGTASSRAADDRRRRGQRLLAGDRPGPARTAPGRRAASQSSRRDRPPPVSRSVIGPRLGPAGSVATLLMPAPPAAASVPLPAGPRRGRVRRCRHRRRPAAGPAAAALGRPQREPAGDLVGDDDREHDRALDDRDHRRRDVGELQRHERPGRGRRTAAPRRRCRPGWLRPSSATAMPRKPRPAVKSVRVVRGCRRAGRAGRSARRRRRRAASS